LPLVIWFDSIIEVNLTVKISFPQTLRAFVALGLMVAITGSMADAQQWGLPYTQAPFTSLTPQMMSIGRWYVAGGARWRQGQKVSFEKNSDSGGYTVPFGPQVPTSSFSFTRAVDNAGVWIYDNGNIDPNNPGLNPPQTFGNTTVVTNPGDSAWTNSSSLGTQVFQWFDPSTTPSTPNWSYYNVGSFSVQNASQFNALTFGNATSVSYNLAFNPQGPTVTDGGFTSLTFDNSFWCPYVEIGFWSGDVISIAYSFSGFSFSNSFQKNLPATLYPVVNGLTDSYTFSSIGFNSDGTPAPSNPTLITAPFSSKEIGTSGSVLYSYSIDPLSGTRVFTDNGVVAPPVAVTENLSVGLNANCYENRLAVLLMGPILPPYELGMSLGPVATLVHSTLNYQNIVLNPNNPDEVLLTNIGSRVKDQWSYGAFGSLDLRVSLRNTFFGCSFDYVSYMSVKHGVDGIQSTINPGGTSLSLGGGLKF
jgi:hypothetical protein